MFQFQLDPRSDFSENGSLERFRAFVDAVFADVSLADDAFANEKQANEIFSGAAFSPFSGATFSSAKRPLLTLRDRVDWVDPFGFDGVVLSRGADWEEARELLGPDAILGATVSTLDEAFAAFEANARGLIDYLEAGPVFAANDRSEATGPAFLRAIADSTDGAPPIPVFAFGGINPQNLEEIFDSGTERVVVGSAILGSDDKRAATLRLKSLF